MSSEEYKATRERLGMTQAQLAEAVGVKRLRIVQRENGATITREAELAILSLRKPRTPRKQGNTKMSHAEERE
jgi:DNA-binding XRE family transcriptional regulator